MTVYTEKSETTFLVGNLQFVMIGDAKNEILNVKDFTYLFS